MDKPFLSIVIPYHTHPNTVHFLKRQLNYYHHQSFSVFVIVALSGNRALINELGEYIKNLQDSRFIFFSTNEKNITNVSAYIKKILAAIKLVKTSYVVLNGADDLVILPEIQKGIEILEKKLDVAAVKGHTTYFNCNLGVVFNSSDLEIKSKCSYKRLNIVMKDLDSIFYVIRRTEDLLQDYKNIVQLMEMSNIVENSLYHIEHFAALSLGARGNLCVFSSPWRIQSSHDDNHSSHTPASYIRIKLGIVEKSSFEWFKSATKNMEDLSYSYYKYLWVCHQIRGVSVTLKQIAYNFIKKNCSFLDFIRMSSYWMANKIFIFAQKILPTKWFGEKLVFYGNTKDFMKTEHYPILKKYYFTETDIKLIESQGNS